MNPGPSLPTRRLWLFRASAAILSLFLPFLFIEAALFLFGMQSESKSLGMQLEEADFASEVWCLGDSWTEGAGAPHGEGYPEQLQGLLRGKRAEVRTLNLGEGGSNSGEQLMLLRWALRRGRPKLLLFMSGSNNAWRLASIDKRMILKSYGPWKMMEAVLQESRAFRFLFYYAIPSLRNRLKGASVPLRFNTTADLLLMLRRGDSISILDDLTLRRRITPLERYIFAGAYLGAFHFREALSQMEAVRPLAGQIESRIAFELLHAETERLATPAGGASKLDDFYRSFHPIDDDFSQMVFWLGKGWYLLSRKDFVGARRCFRNVQGRLPLGVNPLIPEEAVAWSYLLEGKTDPAAALFSKLVRRMEGERSYFLPWSYIGAAYLRSSQGTEVPGAEQLMRRVQEWMGDPLGGCQEAERGSFAAWMEKIRRRPAGGAAPPELPFLYFKPIPRFTSILMYFMSGSKMQDFFPPIFLRDLQLLYSLSRQKGFLLILVGYPNRDFEEYNRLMAAFAAEHGLVFVDLLSKIGDYRDRKHFGRDLGHPNAAGYGEMAAALLEPTVRALEEKERGG